MIWGWKVCLEVKSTCCSCSKPGFCSQSSKPPFPGNSMPTSDFSGHQACTWWIYICVDKNSHTHKTSKSKKFNCDFWQFLYKNKFKIPSFHYFIVAGKNKKEAKRKLIHSLLQAIYHDDTVLAKHCAILIYPL